MSPLLLPLIGGGAASAPPLSAHRILRARRRRPRGRPSILEVSPPATSDPAAWGRLRPDRTANTRRGRAHARPPTDGTRTRFSRRRRRRQLTRERPTRLHSATWRSGNATASPSSRGDLADGGTARHRTHAGAPTRAPTSRPAASSRSSPSSARRLRACTMPGTPARLEGGSEVRRRRRARPRQQRRPGCRHCGSRDHFTKCHHGRLRRGGAFRALPYPADPLGLARSTWIINDVRRQP